VSRDGNHDPECSEKDASTVPEELEVLPPETAEDFLHAALRKSDLNGIVRMLRDWYGRDKIKNVLSDLPHRDPVDQFTHIRRHAVEIYAKKHGLTPARLIVKLTGKGVRVDAVGSERHALQKAREFVLQDENSLMAARALAEWWGESLPDDADADMHLKKLDRKFNILSSEPTPEV
jgi:hypothetical protein